MTNSVVSFNKINGIVNFQLAVKNRVVFKTHSPDVFASALYAIKTESLQFRFSRGRNKIFVNANHPLGLRDAFGLIGHLEGFECIELIKLIQSSVLLHRIPTISIHDRFEEAMATAITELPEKLVVNSYLRAFRKVQLSRA